MLTRFPLTAFVNLHVTLKGIAVLCALSSICAGTAHAIVYNVDRTISDGASSITGFIETDGTIGEISHLNIVDWSLSLDSSIFPSTVTANTSNSIFFSEDQDGGGALMATATDLTFDFSSPDDEFIWLNVDVPATLWCFVSSFSSFCGSGLPSSESLTNFGTGGVSQVYLSNEVVGSVAPIPIPAALPLFATALAGMGLIGWRRKRLAI